MSCQFHSAIGPCVVQTCAGSVYASTVSVDPLCAGVIVSRRPWFLGTPNTLGDLQSLAITVTWGSSYSFTLQPLPQSSLSPREGLVETSQLWLSVPSLLFYTVWLRISVFFSICYRQKLLWRCLNKTGI